MDADVVVIGAGAAGLSAALWLAERSARVIVLEGRDRVGGRVLWQTVGSVDTPAELGAEYIHGAAPETASYMRAAHLERVEVEGDSWAADASGALRQIDDADFLSNDIFQRVRSLPQDESVHAFLARFESDPATRDAAHRARAFVEGFEAADPALASARAIAEELRSGVDSTTSRPVGSYAPLFAYMHERCVAAGVDLRLPATVERVHWSDGGVRIDVPPATLRARCAIVTVPVGVLQQRPGAVPFSFAPPLPAEKQAALRGLEMGHAARVTLAFRTPFWETIAGGRYRDAAFFRREGGTYNAFWAQMPLRDRTIVAWAGGPRATALEGVPASERIERALEEFGTMLGERDLARRECEGGVTHDWSADPFARGAYSYVTTGGGDARAALAAPVGNVLFFAGEATATDGQGGTVSGGFGSGLRAAREAAHALDTGAAALRKAH